MVDVAWTAPRTWVTAEVVTASLLNTHLRDNMLETAPAKVANLGEYVVADAANSLVAREPVTGTLTTTESTTSGSYTNLATTGPTVTDVAVSNFAFVTITARVQNDTAGGNCFMSFAISGATTLSASDTFSYTYESSVATDGLQASYSLLVTGITAGDNTFTSKYRADGGTEATFSRRRITVIPF